MAAAPRSPAQIEAARRNGAKSRGPVTAEGKARSRMNAIRHGLAAAEHTLLESEDPAAWEDLLAGLISDNEPETELEARLVHRLASALWRQDRADRLEQACFVAAPRPRFVTPDGIAHAAPEETFELARLTAIARYRAEASREASRILRELRLLRAEPRAVPAEERRNDPEPSPVRAANANAPAGPEPAPTAARPQRRNDPEPVADLTFEERTEIERMITSGDPAQLVEGARRAGVLGAVADVLRRAEAAAAGR